MGSVKQNNNYYNTTTNWTSNTTSPTTLRSGSGAFAYGALSTIFDGNLANGAGAQSGNLTLNFDPGLSTSNSKVEVYAYHTYKATITTTSGTFETNTGASGINNWLTVSGVSGTITSILISGSGSVGTCGGIKIDGKLLTDQGVTPPNAPSIAPIGASVGTKQGFSIIQYQGNGSRDQSISHGLTQAPDFSLIKNMDGTNNWTVFHRSATTTSQKVFYLNTTDAIVDYSNGDYTWWYQLPDALLFYIGDLSTAINNGTNDMISYHWHDVPGLQKFGSYTGDASGNPFIELGFRPKLLWIKNTSSASTDWIVIDSQRQAFNSGTMTKLYINSTSSESTIGVDVQNNLDLLSNGFKLRDSNNRVNASNDVYIYCAWAETPTVNLYGGQSNAR